MAGFRGRAAWALLCALLLGVCAAASTLSGPLDAWLSSRGVPEALEPLRAKSVRTPLEFARMSDDSLLSVVGSLPVLVRARLRRLHAVAVEEAATLPVEAQGDDELHALDADDADDAAILAELEAADADGAGGDGDGEDIQVESFEELLAAGKENAAKEAAAAAVRNGDPITKKRFFGDGRDCDDSNFGDTVLACSPINPAPDATCPEDAPKCGWEPVVILGDPDSYDFADGVRAVVEWCEARKIAMPDAVSIAMGIQEDVIRRQLRRARVNVASAGIGAGDGAGAGAGGAAAAAAPRAASDAAAASEDPAALEALPPPEEMERLDAEADAAIEAARAHMDRAQQEVLHSTFTAAALPHLIKVLRHAAAARDASVRGLGGDVFTSRMGQLAHYVRLANYTLVPAVLPDVWPVRRVGNFVAGAGLVAHALKGLGSSLMAAGYPEAAVLRFQKYYQLNTALGQDRLGTSARAGGSLVYPHTTRHKLLHDAEQLEYLITLGVEADEQAAASGLVDPRSQVNASEGVLWGRGVAAGAEGWTFGRELSWDRGGNEVPVPLDATHIARDISVDGLSEILESYENAIRSVGGSPRVGSTGEWYWDDSDSTIGRLFPEQLGAPEDPMTKVGAREDGTVTERGGYAVSDNVTLPGEIWNQMIDAHESAVYVPDIAPLQGPALNPALNFRAIEDDYLAGTVSGGEARMTAWDNVLSAEALAAVRRIVHESRTWHVNKNSYLGTYLDHGFAHPVLGQIARELSEKLPRIFCNHTLRQMWAYKYDQQLQASGGTMAHADDAAVNFNLWVTEDGATDDEDAEGSGLTVFPVKPHASMGFSDYNGGRSPEAVRALLEANKDKAVLVPHVPNRMVVFDSDLFHGTGGRLKFKLGYTNRRINLTLLFGRKGHTCEDAKSEQELTMGRLRSTLRSGALDGVPLPDDLQRIVDELKR